MGSTYVRIRTEFSAPSGPNRAVRSCINPCSKDYVRDKLVTRRDEGSERYTWWTYRSDPAGELSRPFWRSERPWAWLLCGLALWMMIYFA